MNRSSILRLALPFVGALCFMVACGPRMKPVEYEEPKDLSSGSEFSDSSSSASSSSASSASSDDSTSEGATPVKWEGSCKGKQCGETCSECPPGDENCMEVLVLKQCDLKGACVPANADCSTSSKDVKSKDKSASTKK